MDSTLWSAIIGGAIAVLLFVGGLVAGALKDRATARAAAVDQSRAAVQDLVRAAFDVQMALALIEAHWRDKQTKTAVIARSFFQVLGGYREDRILQSAATGLHSVIEWRRAADVAEEAIITRPLSRLTAAAAQIAMLDDAELRAASSDVTDAIVNLMTAYEQGRRGNRDSAAAQLETAMGRLGAAARAYDGRTRAPEPVRRRGHRFRRPAAAQQLSISSLQAASVRRGSMCR